MKKALIILSVITIMLTAGCGKGNTETTTLNNSDNSSQTLSVLAADIYAQVEDVVKFPEMVQLDNKKIENTYGIDKSMYSDYIFSTALEATLADTVIIFKAIDNNARGNIIDKLNTYKNQVVIENTNYLPEQAAIVENASVESSGLYVYLVFSSNSDTIENIIKNNIK